MIRNLITVILFLLPYRLAAQPLQEALTKQSGTPIWLQYTENLEFIDVTNLSKITMPDTLLLVQLGTKNILRITIPNYEMRPSKEEPNTMIVDMDNVISVAYDYLVWQTGSPMAFYYTYKDTFQTATSVKSDSAIQKHLQSFPILIKPENDSLISTHKTATTLTETYKTWFKPDQSYGDSTFLYYEKTDQQISFSLCLPQDQKKGWKLAKIRLVTNSQKDEQNRTIPEREYIFEIRWITTVKDPVIEKIIEAG